MINPDTFDPRTVTPDECADFLFATKIRGAILRWWACRTSTRADIGPEKLFGLAVAVWQALCWVDPDAGDSKVRIHPYARKVLGDRIQVSHTETLSILDVGKQAARDIMATIAPESAK